MKAIIVFFVIFGFFLILLLIKADIEISKRNQNSKPKKSPKSKCSKNIEP